MNYLLDTCLIAELVKKKPNKNVTHWISELREETCFLSVLTIGELQNNIVKLDSVKKIKDLQSWVESELPARFPGRVLSITKDIADIWGKMIGSKLPIINSLIAATALAKGLIVATENTADIQACGAPVFNPWVS